MVAILPAVRHARNALVVLVSIFTFSACNGDTKPTPTISSVTLTPATVVGSVVVPGTVSISASAPAGGTTVTLTSSNPAVAAVPASVTVASGSTSAAFSVTTTAVAAATQVTITASLGGTRTTNLTVTPPALAASFTVTEGAVVNRCTLSVGGATLDCTFNGSASTGAIASWTWIYQVGPNVVTQGPFITATLATPSTGGCSLFTGQTGGGASTNLQMAVRLEVRDAGGTVAFTNNNNVTVVPRAGSCGF